MVGGDHASRAETRERRAQRGDVGSAAVDDDDAALTACPWSRAVFALAAKRLAQRAADTLEAGFDHVVGVLAGDGDVDRGLETLGQRLEEMRHELGGQAADGFTRELAFEHAVRAAREVDGDAHLRFVHGQHEAITRDAELGAERFTECLADASAQSSTVWCSSI